MGFIGCSRLALSNVVSNLILVRDSAEARLIYVEISLELVANDSLMGTKTQAGLKFMLHVSSKQYETDRFHVEKNWGFPEINVINGYKCIQKIISGATVCTKF